MTEHDEQVIVCEWLRAKRIHHAAVPNSQAMSFTNRKMAMRIMQKLKKEGLQPGFPDMIIFLTDKTLYIEMKRLKGGKISDNQKRWQKILNSFPYQEAIVCNGADAAIKAVQARL